MQRHSATLHGWDLDLKDLNSFSKDLKGLEIILQKKYFGFGIDLNPFSTLI